MFTYRYLLKNHRRQGLFRLQKTYSFVQVVFQSYFINYSDKGMCLPELKVILCLFGFKSGLRPPKGPHLEN